MYMHIYTNPALGLGIHQNISKESIIHVSTLDQQLKCKTKARQNFMKMRAAFLRLGHGKVDPRGQASCFRTDHLVGYLQKQT